MFGPYAPSKARKLFRTHEPGHHKLTYDVITKAVLAHETGIEKLAGMEFEIYPPVQKNQSFKNSFQVVLGPEF
jgi:hypothetical protein